MVLSKSSVRKIDNLMKLKILYNAYKAHKVVKVQLCKPSGKEKKPYYRRWWIRPTNRNRHVFGLHKTLIDTMRNLDEDEFFTFTRMSVETFDELLNLLRGRLQKHSQRQYIVPDIRLYITLRYFEIKCGLVKI